MIFSSLQNRLFECSQNLARYFFYICCLLISTSSFSNIITQSNYLQFSDSPFFGLGFNDFYLENFETVTTDNSYSTPGISSPHPFFHLDGSLGDFAVDSVDGDDELGVDGSGATGSSIYTTGYFELNFDPIALGYFPTHVGIVWTDGTPFSPVTFEAFDNTNNSLGSITLALGDGSFFGTTAEDTFFGATNASGISKFIIHDNGSINNLELDHIQYGTTNNVKSVPEPNSLSLLALVLLGYFALKNRKSHC